MNEPIIADDDLQRYVDGVLDETGRTAAEAWLAQNPRDAERVAKLREFNAALHGAYDRVLEEPVPERLMLALVPSPAHRPVPQRWMWAAAAASMACGLLLGWFVRGLTPEVNFAQTTSVNRLAQSWPHQAALAHAVYSPEVRHPVEVSAKEEEHLYTWLSKRLGTPIKAVKLGANGFDLVGGRLLPGEAGPAAQFMYQDAHGKRLTLLVTRKEKAGNDTAFQFLNERGIGVFYWIDGPFGYALSGELSRAELLPIANAVYKQLNP
jgi:anti-sigma factor RsiW